MGSHDAAPLIPPRGVHPRQHAVFFKPVDAGRYGTHDTARALGNSFKAEAALITDMG